MSTHDCLLSIIKGDAVSWFVGIRTYPNNEEQIDTHNACLELEKEGLIYRKIDDEDMILWEAV